MKVKSSCSERISQYSCELRLMTESFCHICRLSCSSSQGGRVSRLDLQCLLTPQEHIIIFSIALQMVLTIYCYKKVSA